MIELCAVISTVALVLIAIIVWSIRYEYVIPMAQSVFDSQNRLLYIFDQIASMRLVIEMDSPSAAEARREQAAEIAEREKIAPEVALQRVLVSMYSAPSAWRLNKDAKLPTYLDYRHTGE